MFEKDHKTNLGKKNARKLKTPDLMEKVYNHYCQHLAAGKVKKSWYYDEDGLLLTWETMEKYIANEPHNFDPRKKEAAFAKGMQYWESIVSKKAEGSQKDADTATLQMIMRNKYGWDKETNKEKSSTDSLVEALARRWRGE